MSLFSPSPSSYLQEGSYRCNCFAGWSGYHCEDLNVDCSPNPCKNGATCQELAGNYSCTCLQGFDGYHCEHNVNDCSKNPCQNSGTCFDGLNDYTCQCTDQFMGKNCDQPYDPCRESKCINGGTCRQKFITSDSAHFEEGIPKDFYCECPLAYSGTICEINNDDCVDVQCPEYEECKDLVGGHECGCPHGKTGDKCQENINECVSNPCKNNATCISEQNGYR